MKKFLVLGLVLVLLVPAVFANNMAVGKFGVGLEFGPGQSDLRDGNAMDLGLILQYVIMNGFGIAGYFDITLLIQPETTDFGTANVTESPMQFGVDFLGYVGEGPIAGYVGLGFFNWMNRVDSDVEGVAAIDYNTFGLRWSAGIDLFLSDMIVLGGQVAAPISLASDDGFDDEEGSGDDYEGTVNATGLDLKVSVKFLF
ncbi:hypothetical protein KAU45_03555 [bacterium]|nr:hypothetical protein [bacterium]